MIRFRLYYNKDTETEWLNKMAADGWALGAAVSPPLSVGSVPPVCAEPGSVSVTGGSVVTGTLSPLPQLESSRARSTARRQTSMPPVQSINTDDCALRFK